MDKFITSSLQLEKRCVFCGKKPDGKNKEHIIPKWLIEMTGDQNREWYLGLRFGEDGKPARRFAAKQFHFPACESCNSRYSKLENSTKKNIVDLMNGESISAAKLDLILDWFDKVRIGLFIGNMLLNKDLPIPDPKFFIDQRLGKKDRCLLVYILPSDEPCLQMIGAADPVFFHMPTSFMLRINNFLFLNISSDFLTARRMGFPFPSNQTADEKGYFVKDFAAFNRVTTPILRFPFYGAALSVYQTILREELLNDSIYSAMVREDYTSSKLLSSNAIKTTPCIIRQGMPTFLLPEDAVGIDINKIDKSRNLSQYSLRHLKYRDRLLDIALKEEHPSSKPIIKLMKKFNGYAVSQVKSGAYSD